jgi:hypothetical protein
MEVQSEKLHFEMTFNGEPEDVFITVRPKSHQRFEAWVEVRGVEMYCWVYKDELRSQIPGMLTPFIERCYIESIKLVTLD